MNLPSMGTTDGSLIEGEMALLSTAATSARRERALGGVELCFGLLVRLVMLEEEGATEVFSLLRSTGMPDVAGLSKAGFAFVSLAWLLAPRAMKSPGGG